MVRLLLVAGALGALATAAPARADSSVVVLGLRSIEGDDAIANNLTVELRERAAQVPGWNVSDRAVSMTQMSLVHGCEELDAACLSEIAAGLEANSIIYGTLQRTSTHPDSDFTVSLSLFDAKTGAIARTVDRVIERSDVDTGSLAAPIDQLVSRLTSKQTGGVIQVQVNAPEAEVRVNGQKVGTTRDGALRLEGMQPGRYRLEIVKDGYAPHVTVVDMEEGGHELVSAMLTATQTVPPPPQAPESASAPDAPTREPREWLGWTLVGVAGASAVGVAVSLFIVASIDGDAEFEAYRNAVFQGNMEEEARAADIYTDVCEAARDRLPYPQYFDGNVENVVRMCDQADTFEVLQWVFLSTAVATGGMGAFVLLTSDSERSSAGGAPGPRLSLTPRFSRHSASVSATLRF